MPERPLPRVALVAAVADNGIIGRGGALPWRLPDDLKHFKAVTLGKPVLMGRRTFESIGRALPGRCNLVLSRSRAPATSPTPVARSAAPTHSGLPSYSSAVAAPTAGIEYVADIATARSLAALAGAAELCVIGGAQVYTLALPLATCLYLTRVHAAVDGDTRFPLAAWDGWREVERTEHPADARHAYAMSFLRLERERAAKEDRFYAADLYPY